LSNYLQTDFLNKLLTLITLTTLFYLLVGCHPNGQGSMGVASGRSAQSEVIIGTLDWQELPSATNDGAVLANGAAVGDLRIPSQYSRCTAFLINSDTVMTNHHCIPNAQSAVGVKLYMRHEEGVASEDQEIYQCDTFIGNNRALDFALLKCEGTPGDRWGHVTLSSDPVQVEDQIYVIHQNCDYYSDRQCDWSKKISNGTVSAIGETELTHNADTLGGSSGSPLFIAESDAVVAIHHAGYGNNGSGRGYENYAVSMEQIIPELQASFSDVELTIAGVGGDDDVDPTAPTDPFEPNNSIATASPVELPLSSGPMLITQGDSDYFAIDLDQRSSLTVRVEFFHADGDLDIKLVDQDGQRVALSNGVTDLEEIAKDLDSGRYYLVVYGYKQAENSYEISVETSEIVTSSDSDDSRSFWSWWF
jgi:V8-like Glu-specific endopeptidase